MSKKTNQDIRTKRLIITPLCDEDLMSRINGEEDRHLAQAYTEMLKNSRDNPENHLWYTDWEILLKDGTHIGDIGFMGPADNGTVELGYGIQPEYRKQGYAAEAAEACLNWAFEHDGVYWVQTEVEEGNLPSEKLLEKLNFKECGHGNEGRRFEKEKPQSAWMCIGMCLGMSLGLCVSTLSDNLTTYMPIGLGLGLAIGAIIDGKDKQTRAELRDKRGY